MKTTTMPMTRLILSTSIAALGVFSPTAGHSSVTSYSYGTTGSTYTQNFDALPNTGTFSLTGSGPFDLDTTAPLNFGLTGWETLRTGGTTANQLFFVGTGSSGTGGIYSFGAASATDRALGALASGGNICNFGLVLTNTTGVTLNQIVITFDGEQWRDGGNVSGAAQSLTFSYGLGTDINAAGYTGISGLTFTSPTHVAAPGPGAAPVALDGNASANRVAGITATINAVGWTAGSTLVLQWNDLNDTGNDHALAIDNFSFVANTGSVVHNIIWNVGSGTWDTSAANWTGDATTFSASDNTTFSSATGGTVTIQAGGVAPHNVVVSAPSGTYTFQNTGADTNGIAGGATTSLSKSGNGTLVLASQNTYAGGTTVTGGTAQISNDNQLGGASGALGLDTGGTLALTAPWTTARAVTVGAGGATLATGGNAVTLGSTGTLGVSGTLAVTGAGAVVLNGVLTFTGTGALNIGAGSSVTIAEASGTMTMTAGSVYDGDLLVNTTARLNFNGTAGTTYGGAGKIKVLGTAIGAGAASQPITAGKFNAFNALLTGFGAAAITSEIVLNPAGTGHAAWVPGNITTATYTTGSYLAFISTNGGALDINSPISGEGDLFIGGNSTTGGAGGLMTLNAASTYSGNTAMVMSGAGTVALGVNNALPVGTNVLFGILTGGLTATVPNGSGGGLDMNGHNQTIASLSSGAYATGANSLIFNNSATDNSVLTVSGSVTPVSGFAGSISNFFAGATLALVKAGTNKLTLTGVNTYNGGTTISGGILNVNDDQALGSIGVEINSGATLQVDADVTSSRAFTLGTGGGTIDSNGHIIVLGASSSVTGTTLTKTGAGTLTLAGTQTYALLEANAGTTNVDSALGTGTSSIHANATTHINASQTLTSLVIGNGAEVTFGDGLPFAGDSGKFGAAAVPEPSAIALLAAGALGCLSRRRRR